MSSALFLLLINCDRFPIDHVGLLYSVQKETCSGHSYNPEITSFKLMRRRKVTVKQAKYSNLPQIWRNTVGTVRQLFHLEHLEMK